MRSKTFKRQKSWRSWKGSVEGLCDLFEDASQIAMKAGDDEPRFWAKSEDVEDTFGSVEDFKDYLLPRDPAELESIGFYSRAPAGLTIWIRFEFRPILHAVSMTVEGPDVV